MNTQIHQSQKSISHSFAQDTHQARSERIHTYDFNDNRPETIQMQAYHTLASSYVNKQFEPIQTMMANGALRLNRPDTKSQPIQRMKGGEGTEQEGENVDFTIDKEEGSEHNFRVKHVANSKEEALEKTQARILSKKDKFGRRTPNICATEKNWEEAITESDSVVPPEGEWERDHGNTDENKFENSLAIASVDAWTIRDTSKSDKDAIKLVATKEVKEQSVGGEWSISGLEEEGEEIVGDAHVDVDIFHVDGR